VTRALLVLAALLLVARPALAEQPLSWSLTETAVLEWHGETDSVVSSADAAHDRDNYLGLKNRANLGLRRGPLDLTFRFDQSSFWRTCEAMPADPTVTDLLGCRGPGQGVLDDDYRIERATARLQLGEHRLTFGDFPVQVGRGIALSLRKVSEFGIDDSLRGARAQLRLHDAVRLDLFGGQVNIANLDEVTDTFVDEVRDRLVGASIEGRILDIATVSAHGVLLIPSYFEPEAGPAGRWVDADLTGGAETLVVGGTLELPGLWDRLSIYIEADGLVRPASTDEAVGEAEDDEGSALYTSIDLDLGRFTLLGELKWYENFEVVGTAPELVGGRAGSASDLQARAYSQPPTIEREDQPVANNTDVLGGRLRLDVRLPADILLYGNVAFVGGRSADSPNTFHGYLGVEYQAGSFLTGNISAGYRRVFGDQDDADLPDWGNLLEGGEEIYQVVSSASLRLVGRHSLHLSFTHETWNKPLASTGDDHFFNRGTLVLGYDYGSMLSVSVAYEYDTQFAQNTYLSVPGPEMDPPGLYDVATSTRQHFGFAEIRYTPLRWLDLRLRGGTQRGGLRCLSGVCRVFPNFTGVHLETVIRF
jgi:hypothetical protein